MADGREGRVGPLTLNPDRTTRSQRLVSVTRYAVAFEPRLRHRIADFLGLSVQIRQPFSGRRLPSSFIPGESLDDVDQVGSTIHENDFHSSGQAHASADANACGGT